jgi:hypothetical protein
MQICFAEHVYFWPRLGNLMGFSLIHDLCQWRYRQIQGNHKGLPLRCEIKLSSVRIRV